MKKRNRSLGVWAFRGLRNLRRPRKAFKSLFQEIPMELGPRAPKGAHAREVLGVGGIKAIHNMGFLRALSPNGPDKAFKAL